MTQPSPEWYDTQYNNRARIPEHLEILEGWANASALVREQAQCELDVRYGSGEGETLDVFPVAGTGAPVLVYIHGGYWRALDKRDQSFVAPAFTSAGALVIVPNYALCPAVTIEHIALQMTRALAWVWRNAARYGGNPNHIIVTGHSAGGHLAAMMLSCDWKAVGEDLPERLVKGALSISGVFDLEPLRHAPFVASDLRLTAESARKLSPAGFPRPASGVLYALVGADESEEFVRQNQLIRDAWGAVAVPVCETLPGCHHLSVLRGLADADQRLHRLALQLLGLGVSAG